MSMRITGRRDSVLSLFPPCARRLVRTVAGAGWRRVTPEALAARASAILGGPLALQRNERVLVVYDASARSIGEAFAASALDLGAEVDRFKLADDSRFGGGELVSLLSLVEARKPAVCLHFFESRPDETQHRVRLLDAEKRVGARTGHSPGITEKMLMAEIDYSEVNRLASWLKHELTGAKSVVIRSDAGTDITIGVESRKWKDDLSVSAGEMMNFPCGEVFTAPVEDGASGTIMVDGTVGGFGLVPSPMVIEVRNGRILRHGNDLYGIRWQDYKFRDKTDFLGRVRKALLADEQASIIGELGIGLAPFGLVGVILQDEKAAGTIHIAFGMNTQFGLGGKNSSTVHRDFLVRRPTVIVHRTCHIRGCPNLETATIMHRGKLRIPYGWVPSQDSRA